MFNWNCDDFIFQGTILQLVCFFAMNLQIFSYVMDLQTVS